jgi:hypothetical protein
MWVSLIHRLDFFSRQAGLQVSLSNAIVADTSVSIHRQPISAVAKLALISPYHGQ